MDRRRIDSLIRKLARKPRSRRNAFRLVAATGLSGLLTRAGIGGQPTVEAGCLNVDKPCRRAHECCSGICHGQRGKKTCRGHGIGTCKRGQGVCQTGFKVRCNDAQACLCVQTTAGTVFCADQFSDLCAACDRDADCVALGFPPGSACIPWTDGCAGKCPETGGRACLAPCGAEPSAASAGDRSRRGTTPLWSPSGNR